MTDKEWLLVVLFSWNFFWVGIVVGRFIGAWP